MRSHPLRGARARAGRRALDAAFAAAAVLVVVAAPATAAANGRYPAAGLLVVDPSDPEHVLVRATYGVLTTQDHGGEWRWICEGAVGFGGYEDPMLGILADGTHVAGLFAGLSSSRDGGCDWTLAGGDLEGRYVVDLSVERGDPSRAVLTLSNGVSGGQFLTQLWETTDSGASWAQAGVDLPSDFLSLTVDAAPSDPARVYVSGRFGPPGYQGAILRTSDRGQTWEPLEIPGSDDTHLPFLGAIDPADPDVIYVRLDGAAEMPGQTSDRLIVSKDGGQTWTTAFEGLGDLLGFALSPDGSAVAVGGPDDGLWRAPTASLAFERVADVGVRCLTWTDRGLYACGDEFRDGFVVGLSSDEGASFAPLLHLDGLCGPLVCDAASGVASLCEDQWGATQLTIGSTDCSASGPPSPPPASDEGGGCACRAGGEGASSSSSAQRALVAAAVAAAAAGAWRGRPRRSRRRSEAR